WTEQLARAAEHRRILRGLGVQSAMHVPLRVQERTLGVLTLVSSDAGRCYDREDLHWPRDLVAAPPGRWVGPVVTPRPRRPSRSGGERRRAEQLGLSRTKRRR